MNQESAAENRVKRLQRGVNLSRWFWMAPPTLTGIQQRFSTADFAAITRLGFDSVRIPIEFETIYDPSESDLLNKAILSLLSEKVSRLLDQGLAVIVDLHSTSPSDSDSALYSGHLERDPNFV